MNFGLCVLVVGPGAVHGSGGIHPPGASDGGGHAVGPLLNIGDLAIAAGLRRKGSVSVNLGLGNANLVGVGAAAKRGVRIGGHAGRHGGLLPGHG